MNRILRKIIKRRRGFICGVVLTFGISACLPVKYLYAEEITGVEQAKNATESAVQAEGENSAQPEQTSSPSIVVPTPAATERPNTLVVKRKKCTYPKKIYEGQSFTLKGTIQANHKMKKVVASIVGDDGTQKCVVKRSAKSKKFNLSNVDEKLKFSELEAGTYKYEVTVTDTYGNAKKALSKEFSVKESSWMWPVEGGVMGDGYRCKCSSHGGKHYGVDIKGVSKGTKIHAVRDGEVVYAQYHGAASLASFGKLVIIYHGDGIYSYYAHCNSLRCEAGDKVKQGDVIATVGATGGAYGTHLHLELRKGPAFNGKYNYYKLLDKYKYKQFNPMKKNYLKNPGYTG